MNQKPTFFLIGAQGIGKTTNAKKIADALGCNRIEDPFDDTKETIPGTLYIMNDPNADRFGKNVVTINVGGADSLNRFIESITKNER